MVQDPDEFRKDINPRTEAAVIKDLLSVGGDTSENLLENRIGHASITIQTLGLLGLAEAIGEFAEEEGTEPSVSNKSDAQRTGDNGIKLMELLRTWRETRPDTVTADETIVLADGLEFTLLPAINLYKEYGDMALPGLESSGISMEQDGAAFKDAVLLIGELCEKSGYRLTPNVKRQLTNIQNERGRE